METQNRVALVTGGSKGIGRAVVTALAEQGHAVVVNYSSDDASAQETVEAVTGAGGRALAVKADIADEHAVAALFDETNARSAG